MGIPRWRQGGPDHDPVVLDRGGRDNARPAGRLRLGMVADVLGLKVLLPAWLLAATLAVTLLMVVSSSPGAILLLRFVDPGILLR